MSNEDSTRGFSDQKVQDSGTYITEGGHLQTYVASDTFMRLPDSGNKRVVWTKTTDDKRLGDRH